MNAAISLLSICPIFDFKKLISADPAFLEKKINICGQYIFAISNIFPLGKGHGPSFEQI